MKIAEQKRRWFEEQMKHLVVDKCMTKSDIARALGILPQTLNNLERKTDGLSDKFLDKFAETFNLSEIYLYGEEVEKGIPLIPHSAFAGYGNYQFPDLQIEDFYQIREFKNASFLLRVSGDSMAPKYNGGSLIACQKVERISFWQWHRIYAICTRNQGILIKRVEESENDDEIICLSENPSYRPFKLSKEEIVSVALVMGAIVLE